MTLTHLEKHLGKQSESACSVQYLGLMFKKTSDFNKHIKGDLLGATEQEYSG